MCQFIPLSLAFWSSDPSPEDRIIACIRLPGCIFQNSPAAAGCVCGCVWNVWIDVKLLTVFVHVFTWRFGFSFIERVWISLQGAQAHCGYLCQRSYSTMGEAEIDHLRVPAISNFRNGDRPSQEPACRFVFNFFPAQLPQSGLWRSWLIKLHQNLPQSKGVESILRTEIHDGSTNFLLSDCNGLFVHDWCTPHQ